MYYLADLTTQQVLTQEYQAMNSIVIYGPPASGKTTNATQLAKHFGLKHIVEEAEYNFKLQPDTLYLSQRPIDEAPKTLRQISIEVALRSL